MSLLFVIISLIIYFFVDVSVFLGSQKCQVHSTAKLGFEDRNRWTRTKKWKLRMGKKEKENYADLA